MLGAKKPPTQFSVDRKRIQERQLQLPQGLKLFWEKEANTKVFELTKSQGTSVELWKCQKSTQDLTELGDELLNPAWNSAILFYIRMFDIWDKLSVPLPELLLKRLCSKLLEQYPVNHVLSRQSSDICLHIIKVSHWILYRYFELQKNCIEFCKKLCQ